MGLVNFKLQSSDPGEFINADGRFGYEYILARNGVWVQSRGAHLEAVIPIAGCSIRGLKPLTKRIVLEHGKIPQRFFDLALSVMLAEPEVERYAGITWKDGYHLYVPEQDSYEAKVTYQVADNIVVELHSHCGRGPAFSSIDDADEQGLKVYGIIGNLLDEKPSVNLRMGVYGYWAPVDWQDIFEGEHSGITDVSNL